MLVDIPRLFFGRGFSCISQQASRPTDVLSSSALPLFFMKWPEWWGLGKWGYGEGKPACKSEIFNYMDFGIVSIVLLLKV